MTKKKDVWIAGIARGHNAGVCLLKNGEVVFSIEEERLTRKKYDGGPLASILKIMEYTDKLDYLVVAHTQNLRDSAGTIDYTGDDIYTGLCRKVGLISRKENIYQHPQVIDYSHVHHKLHAACAFYRSGFAEAAALVVDGAGTFLALNYNGEHVTGWETETIFNCAYPNDFKTMYKHIGLRGPTQGVIYKEFDSSVYDEREMTHECYVTDRAGITKVYEAATEYCGWSSIEAGKTMGLFPYGKPNDKIPKLFDESGYYPASNRNFIVPNYPNGARLNFQMYPETNNHVVPDGSMDLSLIENRRDIAYAVQTQTQEQVLRLIRKASEMTGHKKVVISGGYGLNCVANYFYLDGLKDDGIEIYVEPISNDAGTAMGAAFMHWRKITGDTTVAPKSDNVYLGPQYCYTEEELQAVAINGAQLIDATYDDVVELMRKKNIVTFFQGRSENGPRALGNRSILFDPTFKDGKDYVNNIKNREYFRPFAGSILAEHAHEWFDLRGMSESPTMMYAVNCQPGIEEKIPAIIHVDGTCRIQTVTREQNPHYYDLINAFYKKTGVPIVFNTSFNLGGDPLVETLEDAVETLWRSKIEYLFLPEYGKLLKISNNDKWTFTKKAYIAEKQNTQ